MWKLASGLAALCLVGSANAATFTYRLDNGDTFSVVVDDSELGGTYLDCAYRCSARARSPLFLFGEEMLVAEEGAPSYSGNEVEIGFFAVGWADVYHEDAILGYISIEYVLDFQVDEWRSTSLLDVFSRGGTYRKDGDISFTYDYELAEFCTLNYELCPDWSRNEGIFQITSINGVPTPIPAAGLFLLTGLGGLVAWRRSHHSM